MCPPHLLVSFSPFYYFFLFFSSSSMLSVFVHVVLSLFFLFSHVQFAAFPALSPSFLPLPCCGSFIFIFCFHFFLSSASSSPFHFFIIFFFPLSVYLFNLNFLSSFLSIFSISSISIPLPFFLPPLHFVIFLIFLPLSLLLLSRLPCVGGGVFDLIIVV